MSKLIITTAEELKQLIQETVSIEMKKVFDEIKPDDLLDIIQVADIFGVSKKTIHVWKKEGIIPFHKYGGKLRFKRSEIMEAKDVFQKYSHFKTSKISENENM